MRQSERLRQGIGGNISDSVSTARRDSLSLPPGAGGKIPVNRYEGLTRVPGGAWLIPLDMLSPDPDQPRKELDPDELQRLADSLRDRGQLQPCRVRKDEASGRWIILAGERRYRAAKIAGLKGLECVDTIKEQTPDQILLDQVTENCLRDDLKPVEQARAFALLMEMKGWNNRELASHLHLSESQVSRVIALVTLPPKVQDSVDSGELPVSVAYQITRLETPEAQSEVAREIVTGRLTRDEAVERVKAVRAKRRPSGEKREPVTVDVGGATVTIRWARAGGPEPIAALRAAIKQLQTESRGESAA